MKPVPYLSMGRLSKAKLYNSLIQKRLAQFTGKHHRNTVGKSHASRDLGDHQIAVLQVAERITEWKNFMTLFRVTRELGCNALGKCWNRTRSLKWALGGIDLLSARVIVIAGPAFIDAITVEYHLYPLCFGAFVHLGKPQNRK